jgi:uncharacterized membrane protein
MKMKIGCEQFNSKKIWASLCIFFASIIYFFIFYKTGVYYLFTSSFCLFGLSFSMLCASQDGDPEYITETRLNFLLGSFRFIVVALLASSILTEILLHLGFEGSRFYILSSLSSMYLMFHIDFLTSRVLLLFHK